MTDHDPMCILSDPCPVLNEPGPHQLSRPLLYEVCGLCDSVCECALIARVRADERDKERWYLSQQEQDDLIAKGRAEARDAVAALRNSTSHTERTWLPLDDALAAIDGLRGGS